MRLWTIQPVEFWNLSTERGVIRCDGRRILWPRHFGPYYRWMKTQMEKRIPGYGGRYPIWCYVKKPDLRSTSFGKGGTRQVRIEFEAPDEKVLISDFGLWHVPLNNGYLGVSEVDCDAFDRMVEERNGRRFARPCDDDYPEDLKERLLDSWERIFPDRWHELEDREFYGATGSIEAARWYDLQACVEEVPVGWVVKTREFTTRYSEYEQDSKKKRAWERSIKRARQQTSRTDP